MLLTVVAINKETAESIVIRFQNELEALGQRHDLDYQIHFSHGIIEFNPEVHTSIGDLLNAGDGLMYSQKHQ